MKRDTGNPGDPAMVGLSVFGNTLHFTFGLPCGADGGQGPPGNNGNDGATGLQGPPGEVSNAQLTSAINGRSANSNGVATLDSAFSDPPSFADYEALRAKVNELILNGRR